MRLGCGTVVGVVFVTLKCMGFIAWSWWWVLAPFWAPPAIALCFYAISVAMYWMAGGDE